MLLFSLFFTLFLLISIDTMTLYFISFELNSCLGRTALPWLHDGIRCPFYLLFPSFRCSALGESFFSAFPTTFRVSTIRGGADRMLYILLLCKHMLVYICFIAVLTRTLFRCQRARAGRSTPRGAAVLTPWAARVSICLFLLCFPSQIFNKFLLNIFQDWRGQTGSNSKESRYTRVSSSY